MTSFVSGCKDDVGIVFYFSLVPISYVCFQAQVIVISLELWFSARRMCCGLSSMKDITTTTNSQCRSCFCGVLGDLDVGGFLSLKKREGQRVSRREALGEGARLKGARRFLP